MDENYVKSTEIWLETMEVLLEQNQSDLDHMNKSIELLEREIVLKKERINFDFNWKETVKTELENYKKSFSEDIK